MEVIFLDKDKKTIKKCISELNRDKNFKDKLNEYISKCDTLKIISVQKLGFSHEHINNKNPITIQGKFLNHSDINDKVKQYLNELYRIELGTEPIRDISIKYKEEEGGGNWNDLNGLKVIAKKISSLEEIKEGQEVEYLHFDRSRQEAPSRIPGKVLVIRERQLDLLRNDKQTTTVDIDQVIVPRTFYLNVTIVSPSLSHP